jgi:hypothetical protein
MMRLCFALELCVALICIGGSTGAYQLGVEVSLRTHRARGVKAGGQGRDMVWDIGSFCFSDPLFRSC